VLNRHPECFLSIFDLAAEDMDVRPPAAGVMARSDTKDERDGTARHGTARHGFQHGDEFRPLIVTYLHCYIPTVP
jgi:hypothetical protein